MTMLIPIRDANPYRRFPMVTVLLIVANLYVFLTVPPTDVNLLHYGATPCDVLGRCTIPALQQFQGRSPLFTVFTSMFMHGGIAHLAGNMLYLWVFGNNVEDRLGHTAYTAFYLVCGLAAAGTHFLVAGSSTVPVVGASGAISGVLGAYFVLFPRAKVLSLVPFLLFIPVEVSAGYVLGVWFLMQLLGGFAGIGLSQGAGSGVAFWAHVGGFAAGYVIMRAVGGRARRPDPVQRWMGPGPDPG